MPNPHIKRRVGVNFAPKLVSIKECIPEKHSHARLAERIFIELRRTKTVQRTGDSSVIRDVLQDGKTNYGHSAKNILIGKTEKMHTGRLCSENMAFRSVTTAKSATFAFLSSITSMKIGKTIPKRTFVGYAEIAIISFITERHSSLAMTEKSWYYCACSENMAAIAQWLSAPGCGPGYESSILSSRPMKTPPIRRCFL